MEFDLTTMPDDPERDQEGLEMSILRPEL